MRSLLFHRLLSQHPVLPTPKSSSRLHFRLFTASIAFVAPWRHSALSFSHFWANMSALQDSLYVAGCCFALLPQEDTTLRHGAMAPHRLPATWWPDPYQNWTPLAPHCVRCSAGVTSEQTMTFQDTPRCVRHGVHGALKAKVLSTFGALVRVLCHQHSRWCA
jgi:hypothetical protein